MELLDIYKRVLNFAGLEADAEGYVRIIGDETRDQFLVNGKALVLPTDQQLRSMDSSKKMAFHPLAESTIRGESPIIQKLKDTINTNLGLRFGYLGQELIRIVGSPAVQQRLSPEQAAVIIQIKDADETTLLNWNNTLRQLVLQRPTRGFLNVFLRRGGDYKGEKYARVGITTFPYYKELLTGEQEVAKIRKKDYPTFTQIHQAIFPEIDMDEAYNFGFRGQVAPFFCTLLITSARLAICMNEMADLFKGFFEDPDIIKSDVSWLGSIQNADSLSAMIRAIPLQEGNDGDLVPTEQRAAVPVPSTAAVPTPATPAAPAAPATPVTPAAPATPPPPQYPQGWYPGAPGYPLPPGYPPPAAAAPSLPSEMYTSRGLNFKAVAAMNPNIAYGPNTLGPQLDAKARAEQMQAWQQAQMQRGYPPPPPGYPYPPVAVDPWGCLHPPTIIDAWGNPILPAPYR